MPEGAWSNALISPGTASTNHYANCLETLQIQPSKVTLWSDMRFVKNFTPPDFQAKDFTSPISTASVIKTQKNECFWRNLHHRQKILHCRRQWRQWQISPLKASASVTWLSSYFIKLLIPQHYGHCQLSLHQVHLLQVHQPWHKVELFLDECPCFQLRAYMHFSMCFIFLFNFLYELGNLSFTF